jgi:ABC-type transport system involved in cytochrome bd biosynthesis fused ATPase/permease subunit
LVREGKARIVIGLLLTRWKVGLGIFGALAVFGLIAASWHYRHAYHAEKALRKADRAAYGQAQTEAALIAHRALEATEAKYRTKANEADQSYRAGLADARSAADRYIAANRVRNQTAASQASGAVAAARDRTTGVLQGVPASAFVAVPDRDVQACTAAYIYAVKAREWALTLPN